jgi:hypothetical protein
MLTAAAERYKVPAGKPLVAPRSQSTAPKAEPGSVVLHLVSRIDHRYSWGEFPAENWIVLSPADVKAFAPPRSEAGEKWPVDEKVAAKILTHFYPQTETCNHAKDTLLDGGHQHRIVRQSLTGEVIAIRKDVVRIRLGGDVRIKHTFYPKKDDDNHVEAKVLGYVDVHAKTGAVQTLRLATHQGTYGKYGFAVAVQSITGIE